MAAVNKLFERLPHISIAQYSEPMCKTKNIEQWKARPLAVGTPPEAVREIKSPADGFRLVGLRFIYLSVAGDCISADLKDRVFFIDAASDVWLSQ